jgi:hypothetical protein
MVNKFSVFERAIAQRLGSLPQIKRVLKREYQYLNYFFYRKPYNYKSTYKLNEISCGEKETFFGYYDKSPESKNGNFIIFHQSLIPTNDKPNNLQPIQIFLRDLVQDKEVLVGESKTYNWQQGAKLQWISDNKFIFNFYDSFSNSYKSRILDTTKRENVTIINSPIYDCYEDLFGLSLNFNRLAQLRPDYGYTNIIEEIDYTNNKEDGIYYVDLQNNTSRLLLSFEQIIGVSFLANMKNARHKINHIMISPDGKQFIFIHRWFLPSGKRIDRLLISEIRGNNLRIISDSSMVSHCCWYDNNIVFGYLRDSSYGDSFYRINTKNLSIELISEKLIGMGDGHLSILNNKMVFDSYPDRSRMKHLYIYNLIENSVTQIGEFLEPLKYFGETRCDLHPRWSYNGNRVYFDSTHTGERKLYSVILS